MSSITVVALNKIAKEKTAMLQELFDMEPIHVDVKDPKTKQLRPRRQGDDIVYLWDKLYANDPKMEGIVVETITGPSTPNKDYVDDVKNANPAMPYQQLRALVGDGGKWKWPQIWKNLDLLPRRGPAWRHIDDPSNMGKIENPNPDIIPLNCLVVGGGPVGCRLAIELALGGHRVTLWEKRREIIDPETGQFESVGFTNRVNRPHINNFCRNDLDRLNGRNFMTPKMCYPVFTNGHTSSIGIDESQMLLMKTALLVGVNFILGVGYETAEIDIAQEKNQRPSWMVSFTADEKAQERYGKPVEGTEHFDALFGCDGGQSRVRQTQVEWLGEPKTRVYKKMFGIVSNLRKVGKTKLKELGYDNGLEPEDMAGGTTGNFFYKASYHNYFIAHPSAAEMEAEGIPWQGIFGFHKARSEANKEKEDQKKNLKRFMTKKAKELGIPIDETLENDGFIPAPNDVMGFDFSEFYNCEKSAAFMGPPLDWDVEKDGEWEIFCPLVALAGDSVADPNWLLGVGLQRGWNSALDATFYADNIYNTKSFTGAPFDKDEPVETPVEWSQHLDHLMNLMVKLANNSRESKLSEEMDIGMLEEKGPVVAQIRRQLKARNIEAPVPQYLPPVEPWYRYKEFTRIIKKQYAGRDLFDNIHPWATRELAIFNHNEKWVDRGALIKKKVTRPTASMLTWPKRFECSAFWSMMKLLEIDGKNPPGVKPVGGAAAPTLAAKEEEEPTKEEEDFTTEAPPPTPNREEVMEKATQKSMRLRESVIMAAMSSPRASVGSSSENSFFFNKKPQETGATGVPRMLPVQAAARRESMMKPANDGPVSSATLAAAVASRSKGEPVKLESVFAHPPTIQSGGHGGGGAAAGLSMDDLGAITELSDLLRSAKIGKEDPLDKVKIRCLQYEQESLQAKLIYAEKEVASVKAQQQAVNAKLVYAEIDLEMIKKALKLNQDAEAELAK